MDQVTISKEEDVAEPTYQRGSNPTGPTEFSVQVLSNNITEIEDKNKTIKTLKLQIQEEANCAITVLELV